MPIQCVMVSVGTLPLTNICCAIRFTAKNGNPWAKYSEFTQVNGERRAARDGGGGRVGVASGQVPGVQSRRIHWALGDLFPGGEGAR